MKNLVASKGNKIAFELSEKYIDDYLDILTDDFSIDESFSFEEIPLQEVNHFAIKKYFLKNKKQKKIHLLKRYVKS